MSTPVFRRDTRFTTVQRFRSLTFLPHNCEIEVYTCPVQNHANHPVGMESMAGGIEEAKSARRGIEREGWIRVESESRVQDDARDTRAAVDATLERKSGVGLPPPDTGRRGRLRPSLPRECREIFVGRVDATRQSGPRPFRGRTPVVLPSNVVSLLCFATHLRRWSILPPRNRISHETRSSKGREK